MRYDVNYDGQVMLSMSNQFVKCYETGRICVSVHHFSRPWHDCANAMIATKLEEKWANVKILIILMGNN